MKPSEFAKEIKNMRSKEVVNSKTRNLINEITQGKQKSENEWIDLEIKVKEFIRNEASVEDKKELSKYTEMLLIVCNGIRSKNKEK